MIRLFKRYYPVRNIFFVIGEGLLMFIAVNTTSALLNGSDTSHSPIALFAGNFLITFISQICLYYNEMYNLSVLKNSRELISRLIQSLGGAAIILSGIHLWLGHDIISTKVFVVSLLCIITLVMSWRFLYSVVLHRKVFDKTVMVVGNSRLIHSIIREITSRKDSGYSVIHVLPKNLAPEKPVSNTLLVTTCGENYCDLSELALALDTRLIVSDKQSEGCSGALEEELLKCRVNGIRVMDGHTFFEMVTGKLHVSQLTPCWLIFSEGFNRSALHHVMKSALDYSVSLILLILLLPVIFVTALLIKLDSRGPVFYWQERLGKGKKPYRMYKFRSMVTDAESKSGPSWSKEGDPRITRVGKYLRNWRIDEIPQLWNVLKGDMSFVGPRPEREFFVSQLEKTIPYYGIRFTVKPGISGWAQINYGYGSTEEDAMEKLNYDLYYIKNASVFMDLFIVFRTTKTVILGVENGAGAVAKSPA